MGQRLTKWSKLLPRITLTFAFYEVDGEIVGVVEELLNVEERGTTIEEVQEKLHRAAELELAANRWQTRQSMRGARVAHRGLICVEMPDDEEQTGERE